MIKLDLRILLRSFFCWYHLQRVAECHKKKNQVFTVSANETRNQLNYSLQ